MASKDLWAGFYPNLRMVYLEHAQQTLDSGLDNSLSAARTIFTLEGEMKDNFDAAYTQLFERLLILFGPQQHE
jgi:hypothetical protein